MIFVSLEPTANERFVTYGSRNATTAKPQKSHSKQSWFDQRFLRWLSAFQVPHSYFLHFYVVSISSSVLWFFQIVSNGTLLRHLCHHARGHGHDPSMSIEQVLLTWSLLTIQGLRRLSETYALGKPSKSTMWIGHWLLGITFYLALGIAVWVEGAPALLREEDVMADIVISAPSLKTMSSIPLFLMASGIEHDCHVHLASLPKYSLPEHPIFKTFVCPHYVAEILIYLSLTIISTPRGFLINRTMLTALVFVSTNLTVTAANTKSWYQEKFGSDRVSQRSLILPGIW